MHKTLQLCFKDFGRISYNANGEKSEFGLQEIEFLGRMMTGQGVKLDHKKVKAIKKWSQPISQKGVRSFQGLANYYRRLIKNFSKIV